MKNIYIFRREAIEAHNLSKNPYGEIILATPLLHSVLVAVAIFCVAIIILLLIFGSYTRSITITGTLAFYNKTSLQAVFYIPDNTINYIQINTPVLIRYRAFPYQKFGLAQGRIVQITDTASNTTKLVTRAEGQFEPVYPVTATLDQQYMSVGGVKKPLREGMIFDADIPLEKRHLYEWILEPLFTTQGDV